MIVFREGLEAVLIFAAVTASFLGRQQGAAAARSSLGAALAFGAAVVTWFVVAGAARRRLAARPAAGGDHRLHRDRRPAARPQLVRPQGLLVASGSAATTASAASCSAATGIGATVGLVALGFTSVYREGFEVVLFLQNLSSRPGSAAVLEGVGDRPGRHRGRRRAHVLAAPQAALQEDARRSPASCVGVVLVVMIGGTALTLLGARLAPAAPHAVRRARVDGLVVRDLPVLGDARRAGPGARASSSAPTTRPSTSRSSARAAQGRQAAVVAEAPPVLAEHAA